MRRVGKISPALAGGGERFPDGLANGAAGVIVCARLFMAGVSVPLTGRDMDRTKSDIFREGTCHFLPENVRF